MATGREETGKRAAETGEAERTDTPEKKRKLTPGAWAEARALVRRYRSRLVLGLALILVSRLTGLVVPAMIPLRRSTSS